MRPTRKPITDELVGGKGRRQRIWEFIRNQRGSWSRDAIYIALKINDATSETYLLGLLAAGYIALADTQPERKTKATCLYVLVRDAGAEAPRVTRDGKPVTQGLAQEQMWRTLRLLKGDIDARELSIHASTNQVKVAETAARDYLINLDAAGYLEVTQECSHNPKRAKGNLRRYRLKASRNTGPRPPMVCRTHAVYDPNEHRIVWQPELTEEDAIYGR
jgi:hypothetical protein